MMIVQQVWDVVDLLKSVGNVAEMDIAWLMKNASKLCAIIKNSSVLTVEKYCNII